MTPLLPRCDTCRCFLSHDTEQGECRRYAPRPNTFFDPAPDSLVTRWPLTLAADWCGSWQPSPVMQTPAKPEGGAS